MQAIHFRTTLFFGLLIHQCVLRQNPGRTQGNPVADHRDAVFLVKSEHSGPESRTRRVDGQICRRICGGIPLNLQLGSCDFVEIRRTAATSPQSTSISLGLAVGTCATPCLQAGALFAHRNGRTIQSADYRRNASEILFGGAWVPVPSPSVGVIAPPEREREARAHGHFWPTRGLAATHTACHSNIKRTLALLVPKSKGRESIHRDPKDRPGSDDMTTTTTATTTPDRR